MDQTIGRNKMTTPEQAIQEFERQAIEVRKKVISEGSRDQYSNSSTKFLIWMRDNKRHLCTDHLLEAIGNAQTTKEVRKKVHEFVSNPVLERPPIKFDQFTALDFTTWIMSLGKSEQDGLPGRQPGTSTLNIHRAALKRCVYITWFDPACFVIMAKQYPQIVRRNYQ